MTVTIYHNPECGTSRNVLAVLKAAGYEPVVIDYMAAGWQAGPLKALLAAAGLTPRQALRESKSPAKDLGLLDEGVRDDTIFSAMLAHPVLVNRPIVVTEKGTKMCRPSEEVLDLIDSWPAGPYLKEDGSVMIDANGKRPAA